MKYLLIAQLAVMSVSLFAQQPLQSTADRANDSTPVIKALANGTLAGGLRYFYMATNNSGQLPDFYAHALGVYFSYQTGLYKKFSVSTAASAITHIASSLQGPPGKPNRYEVGLFNVDNPADKSIFFLNELYLQYQLKTGFVKAGRQLINTPFINPQDGRMAPTYVAALYTKQQWIKTSVEGGLVTHLLPRSTQQWYNIGASFGRYPQGVSSAGTPFNYADNILSKAILLAGVTHQFLTGIKATVFNQYVHNVFNSTLLQLDVYDNNHNYESIKPIAGVQYITQQPINNGGNIDAGKTYYPSAKWANVLGARVGIGNSAWEASVNYTHIFGNAQYLMPREWGRDPFYTFLPRERNEGFAGVDALVIKTAYSFKKAGLKTAIQAGIFYLPDVKSFKHNKYGLPSYRQINTEVRYVPIFVKGFELQVLHVYKKGSGNTYLNQQYIFNKVDMVNFQVVLNYRWQLKLKKQPPGKTR